METLANSCTLLALPVNEDGMDIFSADESGTTADISTFRLSFFKSLLSLFWTLVLDESVDVLCLLVLFSVDEVLVLLVYKQQRSEFIYKAELIQRIFLAFSGTSDVYHKSLFHLPKDDSNKELKH